MKPLNPETKEEIIKKLQDIATTYSLSPATTNAGKILRSKRIVFLQFFVCNLSNSLTLFIVLLLNRKL